MDGIEEKILCEIERRNLIEAVVFSSFWSDSVHMVKQLNPAARTGMLAVTLSECAKWTARNNADALHPSAGGLDLTGEAVSGKIIRVWNNEPLFPAKPLAQPLDLDGLAAKGATDVFTNEPERYL
jgi:hypothetical protein